MKTLLERIGCYPTVHLCPPSDTKSMIHSTLGKSKN
jgi:hypothetical protein